MIKERLAELTGKKQLVSIYADLENTHKFEAGYLLGLDDKYYLLQSIHPMGYDDGLILRTLQDVYRVSTNSLYEQKLGILMKHYNAIANGNADIPGNNMLLNILNYAKSNDHIITIEFNDSGYSDISGFVLEAGDGYSRIHEVTDYGEDDGETIISLEHISKIACNSEDEIKLKILHDSYEH